MHTSFPMQRDIKVVVSFVEVVKMVLWEEYEELMCL